MHSHSEETALFNAANKIKEGGQLTAIEEELCARHIDKFKRFLEPDALDKWFTDSEKEIQWEQRKKSLIEKLQIHKYKPKAISKIEITRPTYFEQTNSNKIVNKVVENKFTEVKAVPIVSKQVDTTSKQPNRYTWKTLMGLLFIIFSFAIAANFHSQLTPASVSVSGYTRGDGTYIHPYDRRPPNSVEHDKPYEMGMFFFGFIGVIGCAIVAIKLYSYRE